MSALPELTAEQLSKLEQMRQKLSDILSDKYDDFFLMRFMNARKWDMEAAEKMIRASFKTREMYNIENVDKWEGPKALQEYLPYGHVGYDNEGSPVIVCPFYNFDMWGMLHCVTRLDFQKYLVKLIESFINKGYEQSKTHGYKARKLVVLFDMMNVNLKQYAWRPAMDVVISSIKLYEANYPEILKACYIINAPTLFSIAFDVVKKFLDENTLSKISITKSGSDKWKEAMFARVNPDIVPQVFGGNRVEQGDPECKSILVWAGKIPKEMHVEQKEEDNGRSYQETVVNKGSKLKLEFEVGAKSSGPTILSWDFRTVDHDIKFGVFSHDENGEKRSEIDLGTVSSNEMDEIGFINTRPNTKYTVVFDNSSSMLRSKKLRYWVELLSEVDDATKLSMPESAVLEKQ